MSVDKVILRAFLSTLAAIAVLLVVMFTALVVIYPQTMMEITYDLGMESSSIHFAEESYKRTHEVYYIAYATEVAIGEENGGKIVSCGEKLIADKGFESYCEKKDNSMPDEVTTSYKQYVCGQICVAMYKNGEKEAAVLRAFEMVGEEFPTNNAVIALLVAANRDSDTSTVEMIKGKMNILQEKLPEGSAKEYIGQVLALLEK